MVGIVLMNGLFETTMEGRVVLVVDETEPGDKKRIRAGIFDDSRQNRSKGPEFTDAHLQKGGWGWDCNGCSGVSRSGEVGGGRHDLDVGELETIGVSAPFHLLRRRLQVY